MNQNEPTTELLQWGLPSLNEIGQLGEHLGSFYNRFRLCFRTKTRDTSEYGLAFVSGLLRMETKRNMASVGRQTGVLPQNMQHFMSNSPWSGPTLIDTIQEDVKQHPEFRAGAMLVLDESADQKAGDHSAGASRQHNGRLGKVEMSQVGVFLSLVTPRVNTWIDGDLFLPERWFSAAYAERRQQAGIPQTRTFQTKPEQGWQMIQHAQANEIPFEAVAMDDLYGRNAKLRHRLDQAGIEY
jgi:SRSO17 transposase